LRETNASQDAGRASGYASRAFQRMAAVGVLWTTVALIATPGMGAGPLTQDSASGQDLQAQKQAMVADCLERAGRAGAEGRSREALLYYERALKLDPANRQAQMGRQAVLNPDAPRSLAAAPEHPKAAAPAGPKAAAAPQKPVDSLLAKGDACLKKGDLAGAKAAYSEALQIDRNNRKASKGLENVAEAEADAREDQIEALLDRAAKYRKEGQLSKAREEVAKAAALDPASKDVAKETRRIDDEEKTQAQARIEKERMAAEQKAQAEREKLQGQIEAINKAAKDMMNREDYKGALARYEEALKLDPNNRTAVKGKAKAQAEIQEQAAALAQAEARKKQEAEKARKAQIDSQVAALIGEARLALKNNQFDVALAKYRQAATLAPDNKKISSYIKEAEDAKAAVAAKAAEEKDKAEKVRLAQETEAKALADKARLAQEAEARKAEQARQKSIELELAQKKQEEEKKLIAAKAEADRKAREEADRTAKAEADRKAREEVDRTAKAEADRKAREEADRKAKAEADRKAKTDAESKAQIEADRRAKEEAALARQKEEAARKAAEAEAKAKSDAIRADLAAANKALKAGDVAKARALAESVLAKDAANTEARGILDRATQSMETARKAEETKAADKQKAEAENLFAAGVQAYKSGDLLAAEEKWKAALAIDPGHQKAQTYLEEKKDDILAKRTELLATERRAREERDALAKLNVKVLSMEFPQPVSLVDFFRGLVLYADFNYNIVAGHNVNVQGKFDDMRVRDILDTVLLPRGLKWTREGNVITIDADMRVRIFTLDDDRLLKVKNLLESKKLQQNLWPPEGTPPVGAELRLDERAAQLIATDAQKNLDRLDSLIKGLRETDPTTYETKIFRIRPEQGPKIKALLDAHLGAESSAGGVAEGRKILIDGEDLIIKDTQENLRKAESLLDQQFLATLRRDDIEIGKWSNLVPRGEAAKDTEYLKTYFSNIVETIETMLYSREGRAAAAEKGRKLWYDENLLSITITDTKENIEKVNTYIASLDIVDAGEQSKVVFLKYQEPSELSTLLDEVYGRVSSGTGAGGGEIWRTSLRTGRKEAEWAGKDFRIRLVRIEENDEDDDNDDTAEFVVTTQVSNANPTIEEFRSEFITGANGEYEITVLDISPSGDNEGRARIEVRFNPALNQLAQPAAIPEPVEPAAEEVPDPHYTPFGSLNALLIRYRDPAKFSELMGWIRELDIPILQVSIETKFVTINESRAKEFGSEFAIANLFSGNLDFSHATMDVNFRDQPGSGFFGQPLLDGGSTMFGLFPDTQKAINNWNSAGQPIYNVLSGSTNEFVPLTAPGLPTGGHPMFGDRSPVYWNLRMLEAEGIISTASGPRLTVLYGETGTFDLTLGRTGITGLGNGNLAFGNDSSGNRNGSSGNGNGSSGNGNGSSGNGNGSGGNGNGGSSGGGDETRVEFDVTPLQITPLGAVRLELDITINEPAYEETFADDPRYTNVNFEKSIQTIAMLQDGETIVLGGWSREFQRELTSGYPVLRDIPYIGKLFFGRNDSKINHMTMLIFLTANIIR